MSHTPNVVSFSGGQTSGYMLRRLLDADVFLDHVLFCNTGREHDATLDFVHEVETRWDVGVTWLEYCRDNNEHSFREVDYETAARITSTRTPFDEMLDWAGALPNVRGRGCSGQLKVRTIRRYLQFLGLDSWVSFVGIRADEDHRVLEIQASCPKYITARFPLVEHGTTKQDVDAWWGANDFRLNIPNHLGNCDLCFLKAKWKRLAIARRHPAQSQWWAEWERKFSEKGVTGDGARWIAGESVDGLLAMANHPELPLDESEQDIPCSCEVGGMREALL
jgi:3'-phosphoadenosine 5'-phosphosulfate sulfotransferase (PAPS reductase)/FAD synthetase